MLTKQALNERMWGNYPTLGKLLQDKNIPGHYYGELSISDNTFDRTHRLLEIMILVLEFNSEKEWKTVNPKDLIRDINQLTEDIDWLSDYLSDQKNKIKELRNNLKG